MVQSTWRLSEFLCSHCFSWFTSHFANPMKNLSKVLLRTHSYPFLLNSRGKAEVLSMSQWLDFISNSGMTAHFGSLPLSSTTEKGRCPFVTNIWHFLFITRLTIHSHLDWIPLYWDVTTDSHCLQRERLRNVNIVTTRTHKSKLIIIGDN